jgi:UDP-N-acetylmuramate dehydrogenase
MHANYFVNAGEGTAANVLDLMKMVRSRVADQWGVTLEPEVKLIGADGGVRTLEDRG